MFIQIHIRMRFSYHSLCSRRNGRVSAVKVLSDSRAYDKRTNKIIYARNIRMFHFIAIDKKRLFRIQTLDLKITCNAKLNL